MSTRGQRARPAGADRAHDMAQHHCHFGAVRRLAGPQKDRHRLAGHRLIDVDRHEAAAVMIGVEQAELLPAIGAILGIVDIEDDPAGRGRKAVAEQLDHRRHHALQRDRAWQILQPGHGRLRAEIAAGLGQSSDRHLEGRILAQQVAVVGVGIAGRDCERAEPDHLRQPMNNPVRRPWILNAARQPVGDSKPTFHFGQQQNAAIRRQSTAVKAGDDWLAADR